MSNDLAKLAGGVAVITGAASGIGAGLARRAGAIGMKVVLADIDVKNANTVAGTIVEAGGSAEVAKVDVAKPDELDRLAEQTFEKHGAVRLLVNNAGLETLGFTWEIPPKRWQKTLDVNLHGVIHGVRAFVPRMLESGEECWIANLASIASFGIMPTQTAYMVTKHAIQSFSECLYLEMELKGAPVHVSSVIPSWVKSAIFEEADDSGETPFASGQRATMRASMEQSGMDAEEAAHIIMNGIAAGHFWVSTEPEMTRAMIEARIAFLRSNAPPELTAETRAILEG